MLSKLWNNPPTPTLGMLVPEGFSPIDPESWAVIITYKEDGYVKDKDAAEMDYDDILKKLQAGTREANKERERQGYPGLDLVGWAAPPRYDANAHKMYWAQDFKAASLF